MIGGEGDEVMTAVSADGLQPFYAMEINAMATNMVVVATYWLSYEYVLNPRKYTEQQSMADALARGCYQVLSQIGPYLRNETHLLFQKLSEEYLRQLK